MILKKSSITIISTVAVCLLSGCSSSGFDDTLISYEQGTNHDVIVTQGAADIFPETELYTEADGFTGLKSDDTGTRYYEDGILNTDTTGFTEYNNYTYYLDGGLSIDYEPSFFGVYNGRKTFLIGDSRTRQAFSCVYGDGDWKSPVDVDFEQKGLEIWKAKGSSGFSFMADALEAIKSDVDNVTDIVILSGFNDASSEDLGDYTLENQYTELINETAFNYRKKGACIFYVSVNPADNFKTRSDGLYYNEKVEDWNSYMQRNLNPNHVKYIDTYNNVNLADFTYDGIHYEKEANINLINYVMQHKVYY